MEIEKTDVASIKRGIFPTVSGQKYLQSGTTRTTRDSATRREEVVGEEGGNLKPGHKAGSTVKDMGKPSAETMGYHSRWAPLMFVGL